MRSFTACFTLALGLKLGPNERVLEMSSAREPAPDPLANRAGDIHKVSLNSAWGDNPYPLSRTDSGPFVGDDNGEIFTDDSADGWRIRKGLLDMHNYVRKLEAPAAKYMTKLVWDFHLEAYSRQWGRYLCENQETSFFEHSPNNQSGIPAWPYRISTGENLYTSTARRSKSEDFSDVVTKWYDERNYFDWSTGGSTDSSKPVGHWKQLVRPQTTTVGCSVVGNCHADGGDHAWKTYVICHYDYGNIGTLPYEPGTGTSGLCQNCPSGFSCCEAGLCAGRQADDAKSLAPYSPATSTTEEWYGCSNFKRQDCNGTGASSFHDTIPSDSSSLEFQQCHCGTDPLDFEDVVEHGYFWFRNKCFAATTGASDDNSGLNNIYAMQQSISKHVPAETTGHLRKGLSTLGEAATKATSALGHTALGTGEIIFGAGEAVGDVAKKAIGRKSSSEKLLGSLELPPSLSKKDVADGLTEAKPPKVDVDKFKNEKLKIDLPNPSA